MVDIKFIGPEARTVPWLGGRLVLPGQTVSVPEGDVEAYVCQTEIWVRVKAAPKTKKKSEG